MAWLKKIWILELFFIIEAVLFLTNYRSGTSLLGWDGLYPELNFPANLQRNLFAIWQEYRGVGLYDGMSYAANLVHTLFIWLLSSVLPQDLLRYTFIFLMHAGGIFGMYLLLKKLLKQKTVAILGALFYGFNLGIIQMFYAPLEVFAVHFAFLPILAWSLLSYLEFPTWKRLALFALLSFFATPQGYVPQVFISYLLLIFSVLGVYFWVNRTIVLPIIGKVLGVIFCVNAFWLLPYIYGIPQNAPVIMNSKINQMASNKIYLMNNNRGNLIDVLTFKGFMLDTAEYTNQQYTYVMQEWRTYTATPLFILPSIVFALLMLLGFFLVVLNQNLGFYPFVLTGLISFFFLGNDMWGLNILNGLLRFILPVFNEAFRFPFTKFETLYAFSYTIFLAIGLQQVLVYVKSKEWKYSLSALLQKVKQKAAGKKRLKKLITSWDKPLLRFATQHGAATTVIAFSLLLVLFCLPVVQGHFLFDSVRVKMEPEYTAVINYLQTQPTPTRIATLPQPTFYNWEYHANNYRGSGFLWYGVPQAMLERSFDPWSNYNENYYWELSQALYSHNPDELKNVFAKYQVGLIMLDENRIYPFAPRTLQIAETKDILAKIGAKKIQQFGKVTLFALPAAPLFTADNLPSVNSYQWSDNDAFYQLHGNYIASDNANFTLPFRSLFSNRSQKEFPITETESAITLSSSLPANTSHITLPSFAQLEPFIQANLVYASNTKTVSLVLKTPKISLGGQPIAGESLPSPLFTLPDETAFPLVFTVNDQPQVTLNRDTTTTLGTFLVPVAQNTYFTVTDNQNHNTTALLPKEKIQETFSKPVSVSLANADTSLPIDVTIPKPHNVFSPQLAAARVTNCNTLSEGSVHVAKAEKNSLTLSAVHADACLSFFDREAESSEGYLLAVKSNHLSGEPLSFWAEDPTQQFAFLYTQLPVSHTTSYFILPPREQYHMGYAFHLENISSAQTLTQNSIENFSLFPIPYHFLMQIIADTGKNQRAVTTKNAAFLHPNPSLYDVSADFSHMDSPTLILSQAFDLGWHAYAIADNPSPLNELFPFFFGPELTAHVKVNNWENGWNIPNSTIPSGEHIVIVFLPQYLEYFGLILLCATALFLALKIFLPNTLFMYTAKRSKTH